MMWHLFCQHDSKAKSTPIGVLFAFGRATRAIEVDSAAQAAESTWENLQSKFSGNDFVIATHLATQSASSSCHAASVSIFALSKNEEWRTKTNFYCLEKIHSLS